MFVSKIRLRIKDRGGGERSFYFYRHDRPDEWHIYLLMAFPFCLNRVSKSLMRGLLENGLL